MNYKISVIVPCYNSVQYIEQSLESLVNQSLNAIQIIMIDDGSDEKASRIMDNYATKYENFEAIHKIAEKSIGAAWNEGIQYASGEYIAFVNSSDYLGSRAYEIMYGMAEHTHSDIVIGGINRFNSKKNVKYWMSSKSASDSCEKTHISRNPSLLYDTTIGNKIFKRSFWEKNQFVFPEHLPAEEMQVTIPAHFLAETVDIVQDTVYFWRIEEVFNSDLTDTNKNIETLFDHLKTMHSLNDFLKQQNASDELIEENHLKYLTVDYPALISNCTNTDSSDRLRKMICQDLSRIDVHLFKKIPSHLSLAYQFVIQNRMADALELMSLSKNQILSYKPYKEKGHWYQKYKTSAVAEEHPVCVDDALRAVSKIHKVRWNSTKTLTISGHAFIEGLDSKSQSKVKMSAYVINLNNKIQTDIPVILGRDKSITRKWGTSKKSKINPFSRVYNYNWSLFSINIDSEKCFSILQNGKWAVFLTLTVQGITKTVRIGNPLKGSNKAGFKLIGEQAWNVNYNGEWNLAIDIYKPDVLITRCDTKNDLLILEGKYERKIDTLCLSRLNTSSSQDVTCDLDVAYTDDHRLVASIPSHKLGEMDFNHGSWVLGYRLSGEIVPHSAKAACLKSGSTIFTLQGRNVWTEISQGNLTITASKYQHPMLSKLVFKDLVMEIEIILPELPDKVEYEVIAKHLIFEPQGDTPPVIINLPDTQGKSTETRSLTINCLDKSGHFKWYATGDWHVFFEVEGKNNRGEILAYKIPVIYSPSLLHAPSKSVFFERLKFSTGKGAHGSLLFHTKLTWDFVDRSERRQKFVKLYLYPMMRLLPIKRNNIVFESFWGRSFNDNPKAIYEYIKKTYGSKFKYIWFFDNEYTPVPKDVITIRKNSWRYFYYFSTAKYFVENGNFPNFYVKRKGQIEMQTLHGTFMKTMGFDEKPAYSKKSQQDGLLRRSGRWDLLISPSPYMTEITKRAYRYKRSYVECGFPRNDSLYKQNNADAIQAMKQKLNLPLNKKIILYAPTFREQGKFDLQLDFDLLRDKLASNYIILLRLHYFVSSKIDIENYKKFVYDVSAYPEIQDLYLISDMMVTDYSSVMFDYAHLKRPMLFFAYDLEYYKNDLRGIYLNYEETVPGPIIMNTKELVQNVLTLPKSTEYNVKYTNFYNKFCTFGRGDSSKEAVERLLSQHSK